MAEVTFTIPGVPAPQGSKVRTKWGVREDNPATRPWRAAVAWEATAAMQGGALFTRPVVVEARFVFPRPPSHYRAGQNAHLLTASAPRFHDRAPDLDKLQRAIGDALSGVLLRDDKQIVAWHTVKRYGAVDEPARADVTVTELDLDEIVDDLLTLATVG